MSTDNSLIHLNEEEAYHSQKAQQEVKALWEQNAQDWKKASREGFDVWRDHLNTPAFLKMLPDISTKSGLDVGCGDGYNSVLIANRCNNLIAIDISKSMLNTVEVNDQKNLIFQLCDAADLPFSDNYFDFVTSTMSFMDMPNIEKIFQEIFRVLKKKGFLQFSILHPCFNEFKGRWVENEKGERVEFAMRDYFTETEGEIHEWKHLYSSYRDKPFRVARFFRPLNKWLNLLIQTGFSLEQIDEPHILDEEAIIKFPALASSRIVAHSLIIRVTK